MPEWLKTKRDKHKWEKAVQITKDQGKVDNWAYTMGVFRKMKPDYEFKTAASATDAQIQYLIHLSTQAARSGRLPSPFTEDQLRGLDRGMVSTMIDDLRKGRGGDAEFYGNGQFKQWRRAARVLRITQGETLNRLKKDGWRLDYRDKRYEKRTAAFYSVFIIHWRHTGGIDEHFQVTWYTGVPAQRWGTKDFPTLKEAVVMANKVKEESDRISAEELGESPEGKLAYLEGPASHLDAAQTLLQNILGVLRAVHWTHWTCHWQALGESAYGDHLLFERLYGGVVEEIDTLAEKMVASFGPSSVHAVDSAKLTAFTLHRWSEESGDLMQQALLAENTLLIGLKKVYESLKAVGVLSLGMDDFLMTVANNHETHVYLLQQRMRSNMSRQAGAGATWTVYLFSESGKTLFQKEFLARDQREADKKGLRLVLPHIKKYPDAEDWVVEEKGVRYAKQTITKDTEIEGFETFERTKPTKAVRMDSAFEVETLEGTMQGKAGDWLAEGVEGERYPIDADIFDKTFKKVARRFALRMAAQVGTDTAAIYAIAPEQLKRLIGGGKWDGQWKAGEYEAADKLIRQHGGAVFHTGADGTWDVNVPGVVSEQGFMAPYGTPGYTKAIQKVAKAEPLNLTSNIRQGYVFVNSGGTIDDLVQELNRQVIPRIPNPQQVGKPRGAAKGFSFHWSNGQGAWSVIAVRDYPWGLDGAEFFVFTGPKAASPVGKSWSLAEMKYVAKKLRPHPGYANSPESAFRTLTARVSRRFLAQGAQVPGGSGRLLHAKQGRGRSACLLRSLPCLGRTS